jgi:hypothetical protein
VAIAMRFTGRMTINGGEPVDVTFNGVADTPRIWGGPPTYPDQGLPPPLGIWPSPGHPDQGLPVPPGIWPSPGHPAHPIVILPPGIVDGIHPEHPIYLPVYPDNTLPPVPEEPADPGFMWVYTDQYGWVLDPIGGGKPRPPGSTTPPAPPKA